MFDNIQIGDRISFKGRNGHTITMTVHGTTLNSAIITYKGEPISIQKSEIKSLIPKGKIIK